MTPEVGMCGDEGLTPTYEVAVCGLEHGHSGAHVGLYEGWEWSRY